MMVNDMLMGDKYQMGVLLNFTIGYFKKYTDSKIK